ncbi:MAG: M20/M25/M40 family metallo-hydrolase [Bacteroidota bacterium]
MKKIVIIFLLFSTPIFAQKVDKKLNKLIKEKEVSRIIKALSADDMLGRDSKKPQEIAKASAFIESEFEKIGLQKLNNLSSFKQDFNAIKIERKATDIQINGNKITDNEIIVMSESESIILNEKSSIQVLDKNMGFWENFQKLNRDSTAKIILVDSFHENSFRQAQHYYGKQRVLGRKNDKAGTKLYILGQSNANAISVNIQQSVAKLPMNNVVGVLKGKSKKEEIVIFSAHYDHIGMMEPMAGDSIANGADDDASGTTAVISLAKYFKKMRSNERTLVFVAFTAEEIGGFGSKYFSESMNPDKIVAMINIEMIGKDSKWGKNSAFMTGIEKSSLGDILQKNLKGTQFAINKDPYPEQDLFYRSDNATLARLGVPAHSFSTDQIDSDKLYHSVEDEFESLDMANIVATIKALAIATQSIVSGVDTPTRIDKTGIRGSR